MVNNYSWNLYSETRERDEIAHHGILGMKWGVRRYQNEDGTLTSEGKLRYSEAKKASKAYADYGRDFYKKNRSKYVNEMTNFYSDRGFDKVEKDDIELYLDQDIYDKKPVDKKMSELSDKYYSSLNKLDDLGKYTIGKNKMAYFDDDRIIYDGKSVKQLVNEAASEASKMYDETVADYTSAVNKNLTKR